MRESKLAWIISGVLLVLLIIVTYLWLSTKNLPTVLQNGRDAVAAEQAKIKVDCVDAQSLACKQDLSDLEGILQSFSDNLKQATAAPSSSAQ